MQIIVSKLRTIPSIKKKLLASSIVRRAGVFGSVRRRRAAIFPEVTLLWSDAFQRKDEVTLLWSDAFQRKDLRSKLRKSSCEDPLGTS